MFEEDLRKRIRNRIQNNYGLIEALELASALIEDAEKEYQGRAKLGKRPEVLVAKVCFPGYEGIGDGFNWPEKCVAYWPQNYFEIWYTTEGLMKKGSYFDKRSGEEVVTGDDEILTQGDLCSIIEAIYKEEFDALHTYRFTDSDYMERSRSDE
jgi:hypothetical protein